MDKKEETKRTICVNLAEGMSKKDSAIMAGISEKTFYRWVAEDDSFDSQVEAKILEYKQKIIQSVTLNAFKNGSIGLEILRRRWPKEWNVPLRNDWTNNGKQTGGVIVLPSNGRDVLTN